MSPVVTGAAAAERGRALVVVKLGGRTQGDPALPGALAALWASTGGRLCVVHGGGDVVSELQRARGLTPQFVGGRRVTSEADVDLLRMALSGLANKQLVAALAAAGVRAVGVSGEDAALLRARPTADARLGRVGEPDAVDVALLELLLGAGCCPVVSPVSASAAEPGVALNVNGDDAAAAVAVACGAAELFFMADVPGVLDAGGAAIPALAPDDAAALVASGTAGGGMAAKLEAARRALAGGVPRVRIGDLAALGDPSLGTAIGVAATAAAPYHEPSRRAPRSAV
jgi:acetylglutamate kinase